MQKGHAARCAPSLSDRASSTNQLNILLALVGRSLTEMREVLQEPHDVEEGLVLRSKNTEEAINNLRTELKSSNLKDVDRGLYSYQLGVFYTDFISECEKLGDYVINVVETME